MPSRPLQSFTLPWVAAMRCRVRRTGSSSEVSGETMPSPLKRISASMSLRLVTSSSVMTLASPFCSSRSTYRASSASEKPSPPGSRERVECDAVAARHQLVGVAQVRAGPFAGRDQLRRPDATVLVGIDEVERAAVELDASGGAGEGHPELLVEFTDVCDVRTIADQNLVHAAGAEELEFVLILHA